MVESDIINATFPEGIREWSRRPFGWSGEATTWESSPLNEEGPDVPFISVLRKSPPHPTFPSFSSTLCILNVWCWFSFRMYKLFNFTVDLLFVWIFWGMFIAEEFYDVEMIEQLRFLHQILPSFPPLNTVDNFIWKTNTFFSPRPHHNSCVAFMVMIKQIETFAVLS